MDTAADQLYLATAVNCSMAMNAMQLALAIAAMAGDIFLPSQSGFLPFYVSHFCIPMVHTTTSLTAFILIIIHIIIATYSFLHVTYSHISEDGHGITKQAWANPMQRRSFNQHIDHLFMFMQPLPHEPLCPQLESYIPPHSPARLPHNHHPPADVHHFLLLLTSCSSLHVWPWSSQTTKPP